MNPKYKVQEDPNVLCFMWHNTLKGQDGLPILREGKATVFGSAVYMGPAAVEQALSFSDINRMVESKEATCFVNGSMTVWKVAERKEGASDTRVLA